jgi:Na+/H+ antiporter NhaD/arsenite permease-like protein
MYIIALIIAILVYLLLAFRGVFKLPLWVPTLIGSILMVTSGVISVNEALNAINLDVIIFLITLFTFASSLEISGYLKYLAYKITIKSKNLKKSLFYIFIYSSLLSNLITNDGVSASWTPIVLEMSRLRGITELPYLYALAFGVTIGSVMLPTGNPQNLLIALTEGLPYPFILFVVVLGLPTLLNLIISYYIIYLYFSKILEKYNDLNNFILLNLNNIISDEKLAKTSFYLLILTIILFFIFSLLGYQLLLASMTTSTILLAISNKRREIIKNIDWSTIIFFISLFMFTEGLIKGGVISLLSSYLFKPDSILNIMILSIVFSQLISNVPFVALFLSIYHGSLTPIELLALAAGSTIAGNFTILGAASNIIISESSEVRGGKGFGFFEFMKYSIPILFINLLIYYFFISFVGTTLLQLIIASH